jgi:hypothetical protein
MFPRQVSSIQEISDSPCKKIMYSHAVSLRVGFATLIVEFMPRVMAYGCETEGW